MWIRNEKARLLFAGVFLAAFVLATIPVHASAGADLTVDPNAAGPGPYEPAPIESAFTGTGVIEPAPGERGQDRPDFPGAGLDQPHVGEPLSDAELAEVFGTGSLLDGLRKVVHFILDVYDMFTNPERIPPFRM